MWTDVVVGSEVWVLFMELDGHVTFFKIEWCLKKKGHFWCVQSDLELRSPHM